MYPFMIMVLGLVLTTYASYRAGQYDRGAKMYRAMHDAMRICDIEDRASVGFSPSSAWLRGIADFNMEFLRLAKERGL